MNGWIQSRGIAGRAGGALLCALLAAACGDDVSNVEGSGGSLTQPANPRTIDVGTTHGENTPPEIRTVRIDPSEPVPGRTIRATVVAHDADNDPIELAYTWRVNGMPVSGSGAEIVLGKLARRDEISVEVIASDGRGSSDPRVVRARVGNQPPRIADIVIHKRGTTDGAGGEWLVEPVADDPDGDLIEFDYEWRLRGRIIGQEESLSRSGWNRGDEITVTVVARDRDDSSAAVESLPIVIGNSAPDIVSKPPGLDRAGAFAYQVEAEDPDGDRGLRYSLGEAPGGMEIDPFGGLVTWHASIDDAGEHKVEIVVDDRKGGNTKQVFFLMVAASGGPRPASIR